MVDRIKTDDASGRGEVSGFKVPFPGMLIHYTEEEIEAVVEVMRNASAMTQGKYMRQFEADFCQYNGVEHAFAIDNATNALRLAATLCRIEPGDEVIIPAYTFCATAIAFGHTGAKIVWADIDPETRVVSAEDIARKITPKTKAIVVVHLLGMPVDMDAIMELAGKHNIKVVEDCAQAPGAEYKGHKVGSIGDFGCFSFHGAKNITTLGEGGMLTVKSVADAKLVPGLRHNGARAYNGERERYWVPAMSNVDLDIQGVWPFNFCIGEAQCALGSILLKRLDSINNTFIRQAMKIREGLADCPEISFQKIPEGYKHIFHVVIGKFDGSSFGKNRDDFMDIMVNKYKLRIITQYYPLYRYPLFQKMGFGKADCPNLEAYWDNSFSFPWWCGIPEETLQYMIESTKKVIAELRAK
jgi:dTDP-4-amino-4,6-dideoxygalactose transaminase